MHNAILNWNLANFYCWENRKGNKFLKHYSSFLVAAIILFFLLLLPLFHSLPRTEVGSSSVSQALIHSHAAPRSAHSCLQFPGPVPQSFSQGQSKPKLLKMAQCIQVPLSDLTVLLHEAPQLLHPHSSVLHHSLKWLSWQVAVLNNGIVFQNGTGTTLSDLKLWETGWEAALPIYGCYCYLCAFPPAKQQSWGATGGPQPPHCLKGHRARGKALWAAEGFKSGPR